MSRSDRGVSKIEHGFTGIVSDLCSLISEFFIGKEASPKVKLPDGDAKNYGKSYFQNGIMQRLRSLRKCLPEAFVIY